MIREKHSIIRHKKRTPVSFTFSEDELRAEILTEAKKLHIAENTAEMIIDKVVTNVAKWVAKRTTVTVDDIDRRVALEMSKYNSDLAYVYQNRGKII